MATSSSSDRTMSLREAQRELTRTRLLDAALEVFDEQGYSATTLDAIAERAGVNRGTIYLHFKNKAEILLGLAAARELDYQSVYVDLSANPTGAEFRRAWAAAVRVWIASGPLHLHIREAATFDESIAEWRDAYFDRHRGFSQQFFESQGVPSEVARRRSFALLCMSLEMIYEMQRRSDLTEDLVAQTMVEYSEFAMNAL
jgi:AcrR family transcriptional regulator